MVKKTEGRERKGSVVVVNRGSWTCEEDKKLMDYVRAHGEKKWRILPDKAGLNRCGKSCRLRWLNYLRPGIKRGNFSEDEEDLIIRLHNLLGNRWSLIAGRLPGRTDNDIKNYWNTHLSKRSLTINDLNLKLNNNVILPPNYQSSVLTPEMNNATVISDWKHGFESSGNNNNNCRDFTGAQDYGGLSWDDYLNLFGSEFSGWADEGFEAVHDKPLDFDQLVNFLDL